MGKTSMVKSGGRHWGIGIVYGGFWMGRIGKIVCTVVIDMKNTLNLTTGTNNSLNVAECKNIKLDLIM